MSTSFFTSACFPKTRLFASLYLLTLLSACTSAPDTPYYQPSAVVGYDFEGDTKGDFNAYIQHTRKELSEHRVPLMRDQAQQEIEQVAPFVMPRPSHCGAATQGVLLVHGLLDPAYALKDIGRALAEQCALVYGVLLPGHGTRVADLIGIDREQWLKAVQFAVRYQSMPTQAVAQTYQLSRELRANLSQPPLGQPTFLLLVANDLVIDAPTSLAVFSQNMPNPKSQAWVYGALNKPSEDARVRLIPVADDRQKIVSYSHVTLSFSPQNPLFGEAGKHKECGLHIGIVKAADAQACMASTDNWKGEISINSNTQKPFQRLSYHPRFDEMMTAMSAFMAQ